MISISKLDKKGHKIVIDKGKLEVTKNGKVKLTGIERRGLYYLSRYSERREFKEQTPEKCKKMVSIKLAHRRLGHLHKEGIKKTEPLVTSLSINPAEAKSDQAEDQVCDACAMGKAHRLPFPKAASRREDEVMGLIHSDLSGKLRVRTRHGYRYYMTFVDDYSRYCVVRLLKKKSDATAAVKEFYTTYTKKTGKPMKILRSDGGGEYIDGELKKWLKKKGVEVQKTAPHTPEQNGVPERKNKTLMEMARTMLIDAGLSMSYWGEAILAANYIRNRVYSRSCVAKHTPFEAFMKYKPNLSMMRVFGCLAYAHIDKKLRHKLQAKARRCVFLGYSEETKGWKLLDLDSKRMFVCRDVQFNETVYPKKEKPSKSTRRLHDDKDNDNDNNDNDNDDLYCDDDDSDVDESPVMSMPISDDHDDVGDNNDDLSENDRSMEPIMEESEPEEEQEQIEDESEVESEDDRIPAPRRSSRRATMSLDAVEAIANARRTTESIPDDPLTYKEAMSRPDRARWQQAMNEEIKSLLLNKTWTEVTDRSRLQKKPITAKWVFKIKRKADGTVERYKARLVARGYTQQKGIDFRETFAPVARMASIRTLLAIACKYDMNLTHLDVDTAFLNGTIDEELYMELPEGVMGRRGHIVQLLKGLYGLKQASRQWYKALHKALREIGFVKSDADPCIYVLKKGDKTVMLGVYVDDFVIADNDVNLREEVKKQLSNKFKLKDLGDLKWCLGLRIVRDRKMKTLTIDQQGYVEDTLKKFNMFHCKPVATPEAVGSQLKTPSSDNNNGKDNDNNDMTNIPYREAVGKLMYAMVCTRPDIASAVRQVSRHLCNYDNTHWQAVKRIFRYLKGTSDMRLCYNGKDDVQLVGYADADWANDKETRRSVTGYVFMYAGVPVTWVIRTQRTVALSSTEAEYMSLSEAAREATWLRSLLSDLTHKHQGRITIFEDNQGAIALTQNPEHHARNKHIDGRYHYCREKVEAGEIKVTYLPTDVMLADVLTKPLAGEKFKCFRDRLLAVPRTSTM